MRRGVMTTHTHSKMEMKAKHMSAFALYQNAAAQASPPEKKRASQVKLNTHEVIDVFLPPSNNNLIK